MGDILQFGRPEEVGVRPEWVEEYVQEMNRRRKMCHSVLMMRHGKVFAEGYWKPFGPRQLHRMYSVSKSFVSAAVGLLADQGRISLDDRIVTYFPDLLPEQVNPYLERTTIRDMLRMATPYPNGATYRGSDQNWIETFFQAPHGQADHPAGTRFLYDTSCSYTLNVLVERLTGMPFLEYLKDNMLRELGFSEEAWCVQAPEGYSWGGSGVECTTRDLARFALVFLNGGALGGKRYLSREYVRQATSKQIDNLGPEGADKMHGNGYGYQIWMTCGGSFSFCGMGGQLAICVPQKDFLLVCTSDMQGDPDEYTCVFDVLWDTVLNRLDSETAPLDDRALCRMNQTLSSLSCSLPEGSPHSPLQRELDGACYRLEENPMGIRRVSFRFGEEEGEVRYHTCRGEKVFPFGMGRYLHSPFPETHYSGRTINRPKGAGYRSMTAAVWQHPQQLLVRTYVIDDYFGNMAAVFAFQGKELTLSMTKTAEWFLEEYCGQAKGWAEPEPSGETGVK